MNTEKFVIRRGDYLDTHNITRVLTNWSGNKYFKKAKQGHSQLSINPWFLDFVSGHDFTVLRFEPHIGLFSDMAEPAWDSPTLPLSLCPFHPTWTNFKKMDKTYKGNLWRKKQ